MIVRISITAAAGLLLAGCVATPAPTPVTAPFNASEMGYIHENGTASISGQAFMRQRGGGVVTSAGEEILLLPATPFTREVTDHMAAGQPSLNEGAKIKGYTRSTIADADGRFKFVGLAPGSYLVLALVRWEVGDRQQGGGLKQEVSLSKGQAAEIVLAR